MSGPNLGLHRRTSTRERTRDTAIVTAVVPARGGSKSIPGKNLRYLGGRSLLAWAVDVAHAASTVEHVIVSTEDDVIATAGDAAGAKIHRRPPRLATDEALVIDTLRHLDRDLAQKHPGTRIMVLLEPTCPFRTAEDVDASVQLLNDHDLDAVATFTAAEVNPHRIWRIENDEPTPFIHGADPWQPRQKLPEAWQLNGGVYAFRADRLPCDTNSLLFGRVGAIVMPPERSIDIDQEIDLVIAQAILETLR